ncbi:MAG TPA: tellurite resistance TerB family protein [Myxococcota bacterium]|nr:tellurite resistance TerB family protein [Myxococcota bacterium]HRY92513.1 tellurite resistance TerB family protein [Myxococcota bacterium]
MGLLSKLTAGVTPQKKASDDVLLLHGLMLMAGADGSIGDEEWDMLKAYWFTIPEFADKCFDDVLADANKVVARFGNLQESIKALSEIKNEVVRKKLFILAADLAMSSGDVDETEDKMLETFQRLLNIDDGLAQKALEILSLKYAK